MFSNMLRRGPTLLRRGAAVAACGLAAAEIDRRSTAAESLSLFGNDSGKKEGNTGRPELYKIGKTLGEGAFAVVKLATERATGVMRAVKLVNKERSDHEALDKELKIMREAGYHRHIVSLVDEFELPKEWAIVLELVEGGEVFDRICDQGLYSENDAASVVRQIALALKHLHARGIVHRDLKPENLLLVSKKGAPPRWKVEAVHCTQSLFRKAPPRARRSRSPLARACRARPPPPSPPPPPLPPPDPRSSTPPR